MLPHRLERLIASLDAWGAALDGARARGVLEASDLHIDDVASFVEEREDGYGRRRVVRREAFEVLVMTWRRGQASVPHDHAGSSCAVRVLSGQLAETRFRVGLDGFVEPDMSASPRIHQLGNDSPELLVTLHVYTPPLPELRRYVPRAAGTRPLDIFTRPRADDAPTIAVVGGGFSGTMVAAHLVRRASESGQRLHVVLLDRHSSLGEGAAYRTSNDRHLLNVPAGRMSAWPDRPDDFLVWARTVDPGVRPSDFLPRRRFGEYVRSTFFAVAAKAGRGVTVEIRQDDVREIVADRIGWQVTTVGSDPLRADAVVLATGHRPPDDPLGDRWSGSRARYVVDPWASLALDAIAPDEPVAILGTGLTAVDVLLTLGGDARAAPITAISRRGLMPAPHASVPVSPVDLGARVRALLAGPRTAARYVAEVRRWIAEDATNGIDWRAVVDGLRPHTAELWTSLPAAEAARWLRHVRPFWEVHRHRMAPRVVETLQQRRADSGVSTIAARVLAAHGDDAEVHLEIARRGSATRERIAVAWVVNCTGPGVQARTRLDPVIASLVDAQHLCTDALGLGVLTGTRGEARAATGALRGDLVVVGTLRKPQLWESTAVPELRAQAADAAAAILDHLAPTVERPRYAAAGRV